MHTLEQLRAGALTGIQALKLSENLTEVPAEVFQLADTLEILDLSGNRLHSLPQEMACLTRLRILFLSDNDFTIFPEVLKELKQLDMLGIKANNIQVIAEDAIPVSLRWLILTDNCIEALPVSIGRCTKLQKVMLAGNQLSGLPDELAACRNIELLRISANNMHTFPEVVKQLPRLAWLAYSSNPFQVNRSSFNALPVIAWENVALMEQLGAGASGIIYKARLNTGKSPEDVAVKVFKGAVTSDGLPEDEMTACMQAGRNSHLVSVLGVIGGHPEGMHGLVMELIPAEYKNLGRPPSFVTCTRDTFAAGTRFTAQQMLLILKGVAEAAKQLHDNGIMHGDLYAHNTLINEKYHSLFGDFGAATLYDKNNRDEAFFLERLDVRAFGCLADDLLQYSVCTKEDEWCLETLKRLSAGCMNEEPDKRPAFNTIVYELQLLQNTH
ncbi:leucine-rich repeat-containing protein kinase family protein [Cytophaga hutchinsonii]|uniref:Serine/threonine protein kinase n=1 Tax=Cytophaga hutchinsonii (strain ATCC 33406 / DSM 1761 / CIP 103989 / NBRC 15051 / NCIMB 9469 / D465) TaxID=269798 RepID=A0A6N4SSP6_CYTH3|nr:leucine-rich repeat-containing protein kinase family protein [Cytophaga hutchinsonii]ABG59405.1 serine/threonine protein kinase [Cytophaga hutchinsonii ATCC 33406]SFX93123.1 serine/threonine protein kinase [Cytophaga hutchinsonii ATCC 33406]